MQSSAVFMLFCDPIAAPYILHAVLRSHRRTLHPSLYADRQIMTRLLWKWSTFCLTKETTPYVTSCPWPAQSALTLSQYWKCSVTAKWALNSSIHLNNPSRSIYHFDHKQCVTTTKAYKAWHIADYEARHSRRKMRGAAQQKQSNLDGHGADTLCLATP